MPQTIAYLGTLHMGGRALGVKPRQRTAMRAYESAFIAACRGNHEAASHSGAFWLACAGFTPRAESFS